MDPRTRSTLTAWGITAWAGAAYFALGLAADVGRLAAREGLVPDGSGEAAGRAVLLCVAAAYVARRAAREGLGPDELGLRLPPAAAWLAALALPCLTAPVGVLWARALAVPPAIILGPEASLADLAAVSLPAVTEELFFRGYLQGRLERTAPRLTALLAPALCFAALHLDARALPFFLSIGAAYGLLRRWAGSAWPSAGAHLLHNAGLFLYMKLVSL